MTRTFVGFYPVKDFSNFNEKDSIILVGVPIEKAKTTPGGSRKAPKGIREQSLEFSGISSEFDISKSKNSFYDIGDIDSIKEADKVNQLWKKVLKLLAKFETYRFEKLRDRNVKWRNRKHRVPLQEGILWVRG